MDEPNGTQGGKALGATHANHNAIIHLLGAMTLMVQASQALLCAPQNNFNDKPTCANGTTCKKQGCLTTVEPGLKVQGFCGTCRGNHQWRLGVAPAGVPDRSGEGKPQLGAGEPPRKVLVEERAAGRAPGGCWNPIFKGISLKIRVWVKPMGGTNAFYININA